MKNKTSFIVKSDQENLDYYSQSILDWHEEYQFLDNLGAKIDWLEWKLKRVRQQVEDRMDEIDQLFKFDID